MVNEKYEVYKKMSDSELADNLSGARVELSRMKFDNATKGLENPLKIREVRRDIARILTEINSRKVEA